MPHLLRRLFFIYTLCIVANSQLMSQSQTIKVAIAQIFCLDGDRTGNLLRIENAMQEAQQQHAQVIVFPESAIFGWINPVAHQKASPIPGRDADILCGLAKKYQLYLCIGIDEKEGEKLYDSAILIDNQGNILLKHRKINVLPELMTPPYTIGNGVQAIDTPLGKIGVMICADSFQNDLLQAMNQQQPDLMLIPYGWAAPEAEWPKHGESLQKVVKNVATTLQCPVVGTDLVGRVSHGPWAGQLYGGQSVVCDKHGKILKIGKDREREIAVVELKIHSKTKR